MVEFYNKVSWKRELQQFFNRKYSSKWDKNNLSSVSRDVWRSDALAVSVFCMWKTSLLQFDPFLWSQIWRTTHFTQGSFVTCLELTLIIVCISFVVLIVSVFSVPAFLTFVGFSLLLMWLAIGFSLLLSFLFLDLLLGFIILWVYNQLAGTFIFLFGFLLYIIS